MAPNPYDFFLSQITGEMFWLPKIMRFIPSHLSIFVVGTEINLCFGTLVPFYSKNHWFLFDVMAYFILNSTTKGEIFSE